MGSGEETVEIRTVEQIQESAAVIWFCPGIMSGGGYGIRCSMSTERYLRRRFSRK